jgi:hypothetical protein
MAGVMLDEVKLRAHAHPWTATACAGATGTGPRSRCPGAAARPGSIADHQVELGAPMPRAAPLDPRHERMFAVRYEQWGYRARGVWSCGARPTRHVKDGRSEDQDRPASLTTYAVPPGHRTCVPGSRSLRADMTSDDSDRLLPEQRARVRIDAMLKAAGWVVQD